MVILSWTTETSFQLYWYLAIGTAIVFIVQTVFILIRSGSESINKTNFDGNLDISNHPCQLFSFRTIINFLLGFSWCGALLYNTISNKPLLGITSLFAGIITAIILYFALCYLLHKNRQKNINLEDVIKQKAKVKRTIPAENNGKGLITIEVKGNDIELDAITYHDNDIEAEKTVIILGIDNSSFIVDPF